MLNITFKSSFASDEGIYLPLDYRGGFISLIKKSIERASVIDYEFLYQNRTIKPYTFAVSFGDDIKVENDKIFFNRPLQFKFSSFELKYEVYLYNFLVSQRSVEICGRAFSVENIKFVRVGKIRKNTAIFRTLSPVLIRSHKNEKHYLCPVCENFKGDDDFYDAFEFNLNELARNFLGVDSVAFEFRPIKLRRIVVKHMTKYGDLKFPAFVGLFYLEAPSDILNLINRAGLGSRRGEGFGMLELVREI